MNAPSRVLAIALIAALLPLQLLAQSKPDAHHHYKLIDMGTFGGLQSYFNSLNLTDAFGFGTVFYNVAQVQNQRGDFIGFADTTTPDPYPAFCYVPECYVIHAFEWRNGIKTDLGALPGGGSSAPFWINSRGWITGNSQNGEIDPQIPGLPEVRAVLWKNEVIKDLGTLGGSESFSQAINDRGQITGLALNGTPDPYSFFYEFLYRSPNGTQTRAFVWDEKDGMQDIGTLGGPDAFPSLINNRGQVAGYSYTNWIPNSTTGLPTYAPFLWEKGKGMKDLGGFGGTQAASVNGLNENGEVVGGSYLPGDVQIHPFLWDGKKLIDLTAPPFGGPGPGEASWINEAGEVVGTASLPTACPGGKGDITHAFLWREGAITDLGSFSATPNSEAVFINSKSQVVGMSFSCDTFTASAFLWEQGSIIDLNTLIPPDSEFQLVWAGYIADNGEIGAFGNLANGDTHAVLLLPCDENHPNLEGCDYSVVDASAMLNVVPPSAPVSQAAPHQSRSESPGEFNPVLRFGRHPGPRNRVFLPQTPTPISNSQPEAPTSEVKCPGGVAESNSADQVVDSSSLFLRGDCIENSGKLTGSCVTRVGVGPSGCEVSSGRCQRGATAKSPGVLECCGLIGCVKFTVDLATGCSP